MNRPRRHVLCTVLALMLPAIPSFAQNALVWGTGNQGGSTQGVANYLARSGCFASVTVNETNFVPLATLVNYDAVLYFSNGSVGQNPFAIGNVLADYADTGRRLVIATFSWANQGGNTLAGRIISDGICPLLSDGSSLYTPVTMASNDGGAYFTGVNAIGGFYHDNVTLSVGAVLHGSWSDGEPLLADKGNVVGIDLFPDDIWGNISGDYGRLFANAMCSARNSPPSCSGAVASEPVLWPPNHKYHEISILGVTDSDSDAVTITVTSITQDEPVNGRGDGNSCPDAQINSGHAAVRAERTGTPGVPGNGRVYTINFTASDGTDSCTGSVQVCVPHDRSDPTCIDDGNDYNSLGPCNSGGELAPEAVSLDVGQITGSQAEFTFALRTDSYVDVSVFDVSGRHLATIESSELSPGVYQRVWNMAGVSRGLFFVRMHAGDVTLTRTVVKIR